MTIVSTSTSQTNYVINNDTVVGYTKTENRKIAVIFKEGEECAELLANDRQTIELLRNQNSQYDMTINLHRIMESNYEADIAKLNNDINLINSKYKKLDNNNKFWRTTTFIGVTTTILLTAILMIK